MLLLLLIADLLCILEAGVITKSSKEECIVGDDLKNLNNSICNSKLIVSLTITANEGKSQFIEANVSRVLDATKKRVKNVELRQPLRIRVIKSPVLINFRLYQVGYVSNQPREVIKNTLGNKRFSCREFWYNNPVNCGFAKDENNEKIFDSQGFCCECSIQTRGASKFCVEDGDKLTSRERPRFNKPRSNLRVGHCLVFDKLKYFVMGVYPPELKFTISVILERLSYLTINGTGNWEQVSQLDIGPQKRIAVSKTHNVRVEYVADFFPSTFTQSDKLVHRYLLLPDIATIGERPLHITNETWTRFKRSITNVSEWMFVNKNLFDLSGYSCNKIGVSYTAFRTQVDACRRPFGSCLHNTPWDLWNEEKLREKENIRGLYMAYNFGRVHSLPHTNGRTDFQVNFIANRPTTSLLVITLAADDIRVITRVSPGRIVSAFIDSFEALSTTGILLAVIQNTGTLTSTYNVYVQHCSAGIDLIPARVLTVNPSETNNVSFVVHSFHAIGKINFCELNLYDVNSKLLDNLTISFETQDTCFCYGFCGCACGKNKTVCPDAPTRRDSNLEAYNPNWFERLGNGLRGVGNFAFNHGSKFILLFWVMFILVFLGVLKVVHMIITQEVKMGAVVEPVQIVLMKAKAVADHFLKEVCPTFCDNLWTSCGNCCEFCCRKCICCITFGKVSGTNRAIGRRRVERGWRVPPYCNGMCDGARFRRKVHRKLMRVNKRSGNIRDVPWFQRPYNCTCKVKDEMPCLMIFRGLFFFFYCPLLPVWWVTEFSFTFLRRKWRRWKRIKKFRSEREAREEKKRQAYVHLDEYSRGKLEHEILTLDKELKEIRQLEKEYQADQIGFNPELEEFKLEEESEREERNVSADGSLSDTSDPNQANEIDELLSPGFPVYFNYALENKSHFLKNPGDSYSIKGRLTQIKDTDEGDVLKFDLHTYNNQVMQLVKNKRTKLRPPRMLDNEHFEHHFKDSRSALKLITLVPLFSCLNNKKPPRKVKEKKT